MTENQVKLNLKVPPKPPSGFMVAFKARYLKYKDWVWGVFVIGFILLSYYLGVGTALKIILYPALFYVIIGNAWQVVKWVKSSKSKQAKEKRIMTLAAIGLFFIASGLFLSLYFVHTEIGQALQRFLYPS